MFLTLVWKTLLLYGVLVISMRMMGKRQIGQLQPFEFAVAVMISELAALPLTEDDKDIHHALIPIAVIVLCQLLISLVSLKGVRIRDYICGKPTVLIRDGKLLEKNMKKEMCTVNDLLEQLRFHSIQTPADVAYAVLETNGQLSVVPKSQKRPLTPEDMDISTRYEGYSIDLIIDGRLIGKAMEQYHIDEKWLKESLREYGISDCRSVLYAGLDPSGELYVQRRGEYLD